VEKKLLISFFVFFFMGVSAEKLGTVRENHKKESNP